MINNKIYTNVLINGDMIIKLCYMPITDFYIDICDANATIIMFKPRL